jgi:hypothetical protein
VNHILSSCTTSDDALLKWSFAKRKTIVKKYGTYGSFASAHTALLSDVPIDDHDVQPTLEECTDEYDDTEVSVPSPRSRSHPPSPQVVISLRFEWLTPYARST